MIAGALLMLLLAGSSAQAHGVGPPHDHAGWTFDASITVPLGLALAFYALGTARLWRRAGIGRGVRAHHVAAFLVGWLALFGALVSPLHQLGERSFTAHMIEHELLMAVAAPLLVLARPAFAFLWGFPTVLRHAFAGLARAAPGVLWRKLTEPLAATILHGAAIWVWHVPVLFRAAVANEALHWLQHASFLGTALAFWWAMVESARREGGCGAAMADLFATAMHTGLLGALLVVSPRLLYAPPAGGLAPGGLTPLEDQQLAGLVMWIPGGAVYVVAALVVAGLWIARSGQGHGAFPHARRAD